MYTISIFQCRYTSIPSPPLLQLCAVPLLRSSRKQGESFEEAEKRELRARKAPNEYGHVHMGVSMRVTPIAGWFISGKMPSRNG